MITNETFKEMRKMTNKLNIVELERARAGMTIDELSQKSKVARQTISRIEKGSTVPRTSTLGRIASALNIEVEKLL